MYNHKLLKPITKLDSIHCTTLEQLEFIHKHRHYKGNTSAIKMWKKYGDKIVIRDDTYGNPDLGSNKVKHFTEVYGQIHIKLKDIS